MDCRDIVLNMQIIVIVKGGTLFVQNFSNLSHTWDTKLELYGVVCHPVSSKLSNISSTWASYMVKEDRSLSFRSRDMHAD